MGEYGREQRNQLSRAIANSETKGKQLKGFVDNRLKTKDEKCLQLANPAAIASWSANLDRSDPNWGQGLDRGVGIANAGQLMNESIIESALRTCGKFTNKGDVVDFAVCNRIEITNGYIAASLRGVGWAYTPLLANILSLYDTGRVLRGAGDGRTAPHSPCFHHHDHNDINSNIIYIPVEGHQYILGIYNHHMTNKMSAAQQAAVTAIENNYPNGPWTKIIEHGTNNDAVPFPW